MSEVYHLIKEEMRKLNSPKEIDEFLGHTRSQYFEKAKDYIKKADQFSHRNDENTTRQEIWWLTKAYEAIEEYMTQYKKAKELGAYIKERISKAHARTDLKRM